MNHPERLRRVVILMTAFTRNLAYFRAFEPFRQRIPLGGWDFWMTLSNNSLDMTVLEWCKLFADPKDKHHWRKIASEPDVFEATLMADVNANAETFGDYLKSMRRYRDKFVAHLDSDVVMEIPLMDIAVRSVRCYHAHLVANEASEGELKGLLSSPAALNTYFADETRTATLAYDRALPPAG